MSDTAVATASAPSSPKKTAKGKATAAKKPRVKPAHPKTSDMVNAAIKDLKERGGSSLQAIKKYISANYKVDSEKLAPFIRKYLKSAVTSGSLVQTKGKGASGSFKLAGATSNEKPAAPKAPKPPKPKTAKPKSSPKPKKAKPASKKPASPKKSPTKKPAAPKKSAPKPKSPKAKTAAKSPTKKPKAPKPKKTTATKAKSPKKAASKKK